MERFALSRMKEWKENENRKPLIIRGARQVGKTWIMKTFGQQYFFGTALFANIGLGYVVQNLGWNWYFIVLLVACALAFIFIGFTAKEEQYLVKQAKQ